MYENDSRDNISQHFSIIEDIVYFYASVGVLWSIVPSKVAKYFNATFNNAFGV